MLRLGQVRLMLLPIMLPSRGEAGLRKPHRRGQKSGSYQCTLCLGPREHLWSSREGV